MSPEFELPKLYKIEDVSTLTDRTPRTLRRDMAAGALQYLKIGRSVRFTRAQIAQYIGIGA
jgi:hypothetical protein